MRAAVTSLLVVLAAIACNLCDSKFSGASAQAAFLPVLQRCSANNLHHRKADTFRLSKLFAVDGKQDTEVDAPSNNEAGDEEEIGVLLELESLNQQQQGTTFMGLDPLEEGTDPFDNGLPIFTSVIILCVSTYLTIAPFFMDLPDPADIPPPGM